MADGFVGEIRLFPLDYEPEGWLLCNGQILQVMYYQALYSLIGTSFGIGNQSGTFRVPNLQGFIVAHANNADRDFVYGRNSGVTTVQISPMNMPTHTHTLVARTSSATPTGMTSQANANGTSLLSRTMASSVKPFYGFGTNAGTATDTALGINDVGGGPTGSALPHDNMMPTLAMNYYICTMGTYPVPPN